MNREIKKKNLFEYRFKILNVTAEVNRITFLKKKYESRPRFNDNSVIRPLFPLHRIASHP